MSASKTPATSRRKTAKKPAPPLAAREPQETPSTPEALPSVSADARQTMIAEAAYYRAERRGFEPGRELEDWLAAEAELTHQALEKEAAGAELH